MRAVRRTSCTSRRRNRSELATKASAFRQLSNSLAGSGAHDGWNKQMTVQSSAPTSRDSSPRQPPKTSGLKLVVNRVLRVRELSGFVVDMALIIYFAVANPDFFTLPNIQNISNFFSAAELIAAGEGFLLVCGEIDLSAGMTSALIPVIMVTLNNDGVQVWLALIIGLAIAAVIGLFNGLVTQYLMLPSFITTLGTLYLLHGFSLTLAGSTPLPAPQDGIVPKIFGVWQWSEL